MVESATSSVSFQRKTAIRSSALARRDLLAPEQRRQDSQRIINKILAWDEFLGAQVVMGYCSIGSELDTTAFIAAVLKRRKTLVLPRVNRPANRLDIYAVKDPQRELIANAWGIREPDPAACPLMELARVDFILVPGLAFDPRGGRIGYGKGYYDKLLQARTRQGGFTTIVAGAFDAQLVASVPMEDHDVPVQTIVTESRSIICSWSRELAPSDDDGSRPTR